MKKKTLLEYNGKTQSVQEWAIETGIQEATIYYRIRAGMSPEEVLTRPVMAKANPSEIKTLISEGFSRTEAAKKSGCSVSTITKTLRRIGELPGNTRLISYDGKTQSISAWARELGISRQRVHQRLQSMTVEQALTKGKGKKSP